MKNANYNLFGIWLLVLCMFAYLTWTFSTQLPLYIVIFFMIAIPISGAMILFSEK